MKSQVKLCRWGLVTVAVGWLLALGCGGAAPNAAGPERPSKHGDSEEPKDEASGSSATEESESSSADSTEEPAGNYPAPEVGRSTEEKRTMEATINMVLTRDDGMAAGMINKAWSFNEGRRSHIEKAGKATAKQISVLYGRREGEGLENWTPLPTESKGYTIRAAGGGLEIVDQNGKKVSSEERSVVEREYGYVGKPHPLLVMLAQAKGGESVTLNKEATTSIAGFMPEMEVQSMRARVTGSEKKDGRERTKVELELEGVLTSKDTKLALDMKGPGLIDNKTGWVVNLALSGTIDVSGTYQHKDKKLKATGKGKIKLGRTAKIL